MALIETMFRRNVKAQKKESFHFRYFDSSHYHRIEVIRTTLSDKWELLIFPLKAAVRTSCYVEANQGGL